MQQRLLVLLRFLMRLLACAPQARTDVRKLLSRTVPLAGKWFPACGKKDSRKRDSVVPPAGNSNEAWREVKRLKASHMRRLDYPNETLK